MDRQLLLNSIEFALGNWLPPGVPTPLRAALRKSSERLKSLLSAIVDRRLNGAHELRIERDTDLLDMLLARLRLGPPSIVRRTCTHGGKSGEIPPSGHARRSQSGPKTQDNSQSSSSQGSLEARDEDGLPLPRRQVLDEMHNMYLGGYETSSNSLSFIATLLATDPGLQDRIAAEVEQVAAGGTLRFEHIGAMQVTESVVKEALRLYPPIFALPGHVVKTSVKVGKYDFQPGQRLVVCPYTTQRDPRWFPDPDGFRPDRWLDGSTKDIPRYAWMPFGRGPRLCYGQPFAMAEMVLALAVMVRRFSFSLPPGASHKIKATLSPAFMLKVKNDAVVLTPRSDG
jgi:hypothetical protein